MFPELASFKPHSFTFHVWVIFPSRSKHESPFRTNPHVASMIPTVPLTLVTDHWVHHRGPAPHLGPAVSCLHFALTEEITVVSDTSWLLIHDFMLGHGCSIFLLSYAVDHWRRENSIWQPGLTLFFVSLVNMFYFQQFLMHVWEKDPSMPLFICNDLTFINWKYHR